MEANARTIQRVISDQDWNNVQEVSPKPHNLMPMHFIKIEFKTKLIIFILQLNLRRVDSFFMIPNRRPPHIFETTITIFQIHRNHQKQIIKNN